MIFHHLCNIHTFVSVLNDTLYTSYMCTKFRIYPFSPSMSLHKKVVPTEPVYYCKLYMHANSIMRCSN